MKQALLAAGRLALAADLVVKSNAINLSKRIELMQVALEEYNNEVVKLSNKKKEK